MDMSPLLNPAAFAEFAQARRRSHGSDAETYDDLLAALVARFRAEHIEGDRFRAAKRRSAKLEKHAKRLVKAARMQYEAIQQLQMALADHAVLVQQLPEQRRAKAVAKAGRNAALGELASKSLHKTTQALTSNKEPEETVPASLHDLRTRKGA